ncbi:acyl-CoA synthetase [Elysia marginata]|uniref:Acyl-CoA synthetase n=1 Tax=Elysia marginata TaxID=1093978 RepID=A0AAV4I5Z7_9GAST|nr:acyl-CoA synthetase [Elysia marginata]
MGKTIGEHLKSLANQQPSQDIFVFYDADLKKTSITFKELHTLASRFAHILREKGIKHGQAVCVSLPTSVELAVAFYGAMMAGAMAVSCEVIMDKAQVFHHCINKSETVLLVVRTDPRDHTWQAIRNNVTGLGRGDDVAAINDPTMPNLKNVFIANRRDKNNDVPDFLEMLRSYRSTYEDTESKDTDTCSLWLTSGTTGMPKLVMKSHRSFTDACVVEDGLIPKIPDKRFFCNAPWSWAISSPFDVMNGGTLVQPEHWIKAEDPDKHHVNILKTDHAVAAFLTPPEIEGILKHWDLKKGKIIDILGVAGYPVSHAMCEWFLTVTNTLVVRYGCSELITISCNFISDINKYKDFDCGKLCVGTTVKAVNDKMEELPRGTPGRLMMSSVGVFNGYMNDPDKTNEALTEDGWYLTSDAGYIDADGHLVVVGRYDYIIMHNNLHIYPSTIEKPIQKLKGVKNAVVVPIPDDHNYHNICACVVREPGSKITEADVIKAVTDKYADDEYKTIVAPQHVLFIEDIKVNERGKTNTNQIIENAINTIKGIKLDN